MGKYSNVSCVLDDLQDQNNDADWEQLNSSNIGTNITLIVLMLGGLSLNGLVIAGILFKKLYSQSIFLLLFNLAIADLCICLFSISFNVLVGFTGLKFGISDSVRCRVCKFAAMFAMLQFQSSFTITLLSLERFVFLKFLRNDMLFTARTTLLMLAGVWVLSVALILPPLFGYGDVIFFVPCGFVFLSPPHVKRSIAVLITYGLVEVAVACIVIGTNAWVLSVAVKQVSALKQGQTAPTGEEDTANQDKDTTGEEDTANQDQERRTERIAIHKQLRLYLVFCGLVIVDIATCIPPVTIAVLNAVVTSNQFINFALIAVLSRVVFHPLVELRLVPELHGIVSHLLRGLGRNGQGYAHENGDRIEAALAAQCHRSAGCFQWEKMWVTALQKQLKDKNISRNRFPSIVPAVL